MPPAISIVSTMYRSRQFLETFLAESLAALQRLGCADYEIVLVNDGSPDDSLEYSLSRAKDIPRLVVVDLKPKKLLIVNRSLERAKLLAAEFPAGAMTIEARPFEQLDAALTEADILLTSTGATEPIITEARFKGLLKPRRYRPIVMVDIAVPRDVEASVGKIANTYLYNIDDLQEAAAGNRGSRKIAHPRKRTFFLNGCISGFA